MNIEQKNKKIDEFFKNPDKIKEILAAKTGEEVKEIFLKDGIELTDSDLEELKNICSNIVCKNGEMKDDELGNVSGGGFAGAIYGTYYGIRTGTIAGRIAGAIGGAVLGSYAGSAVSGGSDIGKISGGCGGALLGERIGHGVGLYLGGFLGSRIGSGVENISEKFKKEKDK